MVECEFIRIIAFVKQPLSFNRYMVECELNTFTSTLYPVPVLIDTWWNVNTEKKLSSLESIGFNRYMVECEYTVDNTPFIMFFVLIDTWWNVNEFLSVINKYFTVVLIDTWWNVNEKVVTFVSPSPAVLIDTWWNVNVFNKLSVTEPLWF